MKIKTLVGSMMVLGLVSTGVIADSKPSASKAPEDMRKTATKTTKDVSNQAYLSPIDRNQDNAYPVLNLPIGELKISGLGEFSIAVPAKRHKFDLKKSDLSEDSDKIDLDYLVNDFTSVHLTLGYGYNNTINHLDGSSKDSDAKPLNKELYFSEAYAEMAGKNFFTKLGQYYTNFGSTKHNSISTPVTQTLSSTDKVAVTFGVQNLLGGFYADMAVYKGANTTNDDDSIRSNGYDVDLGYAFHNDVYSANVYADYISDMADIDAINNSLVNTKAKNVINKRIPGLAVHGDVTMGPLQLLADYVTALETTDTRDYEFNKSGAESSAYSIEASYNFMPKQTITIGVEGTREAFGLKALGSETPLPKERLLAAYTYQLSPHVSLQGEFTHDKAYASSVTYGNKDSENNLTSGSGKTDNTILARLKVAF